jgi:hypothetical protein
MADSANLQASGDDRYRGIAAVGSAKLDGSNG